MTQGSQQAFRAVTWNIHGGVGLDRRYDIERTGRTIYRLSPDIAALQEVDLRRQSRVRPDIQQYLCDQVGRHSHEAWALTGLEGKYGQLLVSRYPLENRQVHDISVPGREPRKVMEAVLQLPSRSLRVIATHLGLFPVERNRQLAWLLDILRADVTLPVLLLGDLNVWRSSGATSGLYRFFELRTSHRTYPSPLPALAFDRIMCRGGLQIVDSHAVRSACMASDHLPLVATIHMHSTHTLSTGASAL